MSAGESIHVIVSVSIGAGPPPELMRLHNCSRYQYSVVYGYYGKGE